MAKQINPANKRFNFADWAEEQWKWGTWTEAAMRTGWRHLREIPTATQPIRVNRTFPKVNGALLKAVS